jgi:cell division initiation protein
MIDLTPLEVRQKKADFPRGLRGYDPGHVDDFLDLVADRLEALVKENRRLEEEIGTLRSRAGEYRDREKALTEALVSAQQMRETVREQTSKEAELMRREAEQAAQQVRSDALRSIEKEEETLRRLRARQRQLVDGYRAMLERELRELAVVAESLDASEAATPPEVVVAERATVSTLARTPAETEPDAEPGAQAVEEDDAARENAGPLSSEGADKAPAGAESSEAVPGDARPAGAKTGDAGSSVAARPPAPGRGPDGPRPAGEGTPAPRRGIDSTGKEERAGSDRFAAPAASLDEGEGAGPAPAGGPAEGPSGARPGEEPDWLAAILKEE